MTRLFLAGSLAVLAVAPGGCDDGVQPSDCRDGLDNDGDGVIDRLDPGCTVGDGLLESPDPPPRRCANGIDDDGDGMVDGDDPGCEDLLFDNDETDPPPPPAACNDGLDNDGDNRADYPNDPGCTGLDDTDETDPDELPACGNGIDDDGDGKVDYPHDPGCRSSGDTDETDPVLGVCGPGSEVEALPAGGEVLGVLDTTAGPNNIQGACGGLGRELIYSLTLDEPAYLVISTDHPETTLDTVVYLRSSCLDPSTELGCVDDEPQKKAATLHVARAEAGDYHLVVDSFAPASAGDVKVTVTRYTAQGDECDASAMPTGCAPGLVCRLETNLSTSTTCEFLSCADGLDNDGDGLIDFPAEPGCDSPGDNDETDPDPLPECGNGIDDDEDGFTDFDVDPALSDPGCKSASDPLEIDPCIGEKAPEPLTDAGVMGTTVGKGGHFTGSCAFSSGSANDVVHVYELTRDLVSLGFSTSGSDFDTALYVRYDECSASSVDLACAEDFQTETVAVPSPAQGRYFVIVDGTFSGEQGDYELSVSGVIPTGGSCDPGSMQFVCEIGSTCDAATAVCEPAACNDGVDNDGDGLADVDDPGCVSVDDDDEADPATPPQCADGIDNDTNGLTDYPADLGCERAGDDLELDCVDTDAVIDISHQQTTTGTTTGHTSDFEPTCVSVMGGADVLYELHFPGELATLTLDTNDSSLDTILTIVDTCSATQTLHECDDDAGTPGLQSMLSLVDVPASKYFVVIDGYSSFGGSFELHITGTVKAGEACDPMQVQPGFLSCASDASGTATTCQDLGDGNGFLCQP